MTPLQEGRAAYLNNDIRACPYMAPNGPVGGQEAKEWAARCRQWYQGYDSERLADR